MEQRHGLQVWATEQEESPNCGTRAKSRIQALCAIPEAYRCIAKAVFIIFKWRVTQSLEISDGFSRNNQSTTVKIYHLPPPWSSAEPARQHCRCWTTSSPSLQQNQPAHTKLQPPLELYSKGHLWNTGSETSYHHATAPHQPDHWGAGADMKPSACISSKPAVVIPILYRAGRRARSPTAPQ